MSMFEDTIIYVIIFAIFVVGFVPVLANWVIQGQATANSYNDTVTANFLSFIIPLMLVAFVIGFAMRMAGRKPMGQW